MRMRVAIAPATFVMLVPASAWACSGAGAMDAITSAERWGWIMFAIGAAIMLVVAALPSVRRSGLALALLVIAVHPGWWMGARGGDCGGMLSITSTMWTALSPVLGGLIYWRSHRPRRLRRPRPF